MDVVAVLENGTVIEAKPYDQVQVPTSKLVSSETAIANEDDKVLSDDVDGSINDNPIAIDDPEVALERDSLQRRGGSWSVYSYYCRSAGVVPLVLWILFTFVGAVSATYTGNCFIYVSPSRPKI